MLIKKHWSLLNFFLNFRRQGLERAAAYQTYQSTSLVLKLGDKKFDIFFFYFSSKEEVCFDFSSLDQHEGFDEWFFAKNIFLNKYYFFKDSVFPSKNNNQLTFSLMICDPIRCSLELERTTWWHQKCHQEIEAPPFSMRVKMWLVFFHLDWLHCEELGSGFPNFERRRAFVSVRVDHFWPHTS